ncbi:MULTISPECIES: signal recognition particle protein [Anaerococcus]|uniref:Signal recognition particle protein n=2 Tax=Anaerococcus TaxID=165779 RepID=A0A6N2SS25_9FIRM|nr:MULTISPECIES: signal recognition particle protein [Anaerococcus]MBS6921511.1 signal recognition particle protein [Anaerococcus vaginalis]MDU0945939.1 signal recognition particle protein [Anaerococcus vaginalis]MDU1030906.1 signal recognition particle protein [Anaerococcus vaginalis]MDU2375139.1 signal recognition particle protein [Anaerococcus vaginalis]MDU2648293.1 signal recognition particle protein [Anaerococcus vaginalis]
MIFSNLSEKLQESLGKLTGKGKLSEKDIDNVAREIKLSLLEADVNYKVVKEFVKKIKERAMGQDVMESLTPGQTVIKIVNEELTNLMGKENSKLELKGSTPHVVLMVGLQGSGKTTHSGKLVRKLKKEGRNPLLVALDVYRPAAIEQLKVVGKQAEVEVFEKGKQDPVQTANEAKEYARRNNNDVVIMDTAGRLQIDEDLMDELKNIKKVVKPDEILLVVDAMVGQESVNVAKTFDEYLDITGVILTKLDGDARGGAALSIRQVVGKPIKFIGTGEKLDDLEAFHPDRMASRILGMGDVLSLIEKAEKQVSLKDARELEEKMRNQSYTLDDFVEQINQIRNMGPLEDLLAMIPGVNNKMLKNVNVDEKGFVRIEALISSMTKEEREKPEIIGKSRKERIAKGSGVDMNELNKLLKQFKELKKMMKQFTNMKKGRKGKRKFNMPFF